MDEQKKKILAICYDFDKTLSPTDMQAQGYIQSVGFDVTEFWRLTDELAKANEMDSNLAYMYVMVDEARGRLIFNRKMLEEYGSKVALFPGVSEWFDRMNKYGEEKGITIEHYIISSGLKEMIDGTEIAKRGVFKRVYASSFYYNDRGEAVWPAQVVNYTNKTQYLFRISKGALDVSDEKGVNKYIKEEDLRVHFRNMVYIGDSDTDIPCMKLVNINGGHSIGVYNPDTKDKSKLIDLLRDNRIRYMLPADYSEGSEMDKLIRNIIDKTAAYEQLEAKHLSDLQEVNN